MTGSINHADSNAAAPFMPFGRTARNLFYFDKHFTNLNHGSFGSIPISVDEACNALSKRIESNVDEFIRNKMFTGIDSARSLIANHIGVDKDTCVFVPSVAYGINTILRNFTWSASDVLIHTDLVYETISSAIKDLARKKPCPRTSQFIIGLPTSHASILASFKDHIRRVKAEMSHCSTAPKIVVILEAISSTPAILLPWKQMINICHEEKVWSIIDAAHSFGQERQVNLASADPDFWVTNCSKWAFAKRGCALLYVPFRNQHMISAPTLPGLKYPSRGIEPSDFVWQFYWTGMTDPVPTLSIEFALAFQQKMGGSDNINAYCHSLALAGARCVAEMLGTSFLDSSNNEGELIANMVNIEVPLSALVKPSKDVHFLFQQEIQQHHTFVVLFQYRSKWWVRASAQIYNELSDFVRLGKALRAVCQKIEDVFLKQELCICIKGS